MCRRIITPSPRRESSAWTRIPLLHESWGAWPLLAPLWILLWIVVIATVIRFLVLRRGGRWCGPGLPRARSAIRDPGRAVRPGRDRRGRVPVEAGCSSDSRLDWMTRDNSIVVEQLVREFKKGPRAVDGIDLYVAPGRDLRLPRPERRRQVDDRADADDSAAADRGLRPRRRLRRPHGGPEGALRDRRRAPGGRTRPAPDGARPPEAADDAAGDPEGRAQDRGRTSSSTGWGSPMLPTARSGATPAA